MFGVKGLRRPGHPRARAQVHPARGAGAHFQETRRLYQGANRKAPPQDG